MVDSPMSLCKCALKTPFTLQRMCEATHSPNGHKMCRECIRVQLRSQAHYICKHNQCSNDSQHRSSSIRIDINALIQSALKPGVFRWKLITWHRNIFLSSCQMSTLHKSTGNSFYWLKRPVSVDKALVSPASYSSAKLSVGPPLTLLYHMSGS